MDLIAVDQLHPADAHLAAEALQSAGLHPKYDDGPRYAYHGQHATTPLYVPPSEADAARQILARLHAESGQRARLIARGWWRPMVWPLLVGITAGVASALIWNAPTLGLAVCFVAFIGIMFVRGGLATAPSQANTYRMERNHRQRKEDRG